MDRGVISPTNGQTLIDAANDTIDSLSNRVMWVDFIGNEYATRLKT